MFPHAHDITFDFKGDPVHHAQLDGLFGREPRESFILGRGTQRQLGRVIVQRPETRLHPRGDAAAPERIVSRHQVDGHRRTEIDDQHVLTRIEHCRADGCGQSVAPQRLGRKVCVADGHGGLGGELQQIIHPPAEHRRHVIDLAARRRHHGAPHGPFGEQFFEHRRVQPLRATLRDKFSPVENREFYQGVPDIYD